MKTTLRIIPAAILYIMCSSTTPTAMRFNQKHDSVYHSLTDFFANDSLIFADTAIGKSYQFSAADIQFVYKTDAKKIIHHAPMSNNLLPKKEFERIYKASKTNLSVMIFNITITHKGTRKTIHSPNIRFNIIKKL